MDWKQIKIKGIASIEKFIAEFNVFELIKTPYGKFKVKIYQSNNGKFIGYTNLQLKDDDGCPFAAIGYVDSVEEALQDTIEYFIKMLDKKDHLEEGDFEYMDPSDF